MNIYKKFSSGSSADGKIRPTCRKAPNVIGHVEYSHMTEKILLFVLFAMGLAIKKVQGQNPTLYLDSFTACKDKYYDNKIKKHVYYHSETQPAFIGGPKAFLRFVTEAFISPLKELHSGLPALSAIADIIIDKDGSILLPTIIKQENSDSSIINFEFEFIRILNTMPKWTPGRCYNKPVIVKVRLDFTMFPTVTKSQKGFPSTRPITSGFGQVGRTQ